MKDLAGHRILVTAGGTREPLDPVRFVGNRSSGRQGVAIAVAAAARGADVTLLAANLEVPVPDSVTVVTVGTARELDEAAQRESRVADAVIMAAAVADYRPESVSDGKIKKDAAGRQVHDRHGQEPRHPGGPGQEPARGPDTHRLRGGDRAGPRMRCCPRAREDLEPRAATTS